MAAYTINANATSGVVDRLGKAVPLDALTGILPPQVAESKLNASGNWDPPSIASFGTSQQTLAVPGCRVGDRVALSFSPALPSGLVARGDITVDGTVAMTIVNVSAAAINAPNMTVSADVWQKVN